MKLSSLISENELVFPSPETAETDVVGRGLRAQMKYADKIGAKYTLVIGDNELNEGFAEAKNMETGKKAKLPLDESFLDSFLNLQLSEETDTFSAVFGKDNSDVE